MRQLPSMVDAVQRVGAEARGPLVALVGAGGELDIRLAPAEAVRSPLWLLRILRRHLRQAEATAAAVVLPVRVLWGEDAVCDYLDAEALVVVAAAATRDGAHSVVRRCHLHALPGGWEDVGDGLQWIAGPLRDALAGRAHEDESSTSYA